MRKIFTVIAALAAALTVCAQTTNEELIQFQKDCKFTELWGQRATLFNDLGVDSTSIVMFGNSITHGCEWHELFGNPNVLNRGINGDVVEGLKKRVDAVVNGRPDKIFLLIGVNDVSHNLTADSIARSIGELIQTIRHRSPETRLYVESPLPFNYADFKRYKALEGKEQVVRDINTLLEPIVKANGATWINIYPHFADENGNLRAGLTNDGLHLLGSGYLMWRDLLLPYINE